MNPQQMIATGYAVCFLAAKDKIKLPAESKVTADVGIGPRDDGQGYGLDVELKTSLPGLDAETADKVIHVAMSSAPISTRSRAA